jgi:uncharacterized protein (TIGR00730 family)
MKNICVFCSSSDVIDDVYFNEAKLLAEKIVKENKTFVFGGSGVGLMKHLAIHINENNGEIIGVIPQKIFDKGLACKIVKNMIITHDMHTRKEKLTEISDAFIAMPGGFGTLDELFEVITLKQVGYHTKPIIILNTNGFYNDLVLFFETLYKEKVAKPDYRKIYHVAKNVDDAFSYLKNYSEEKSISKWF